MLRVELVFRVGFLSVLELLSCKYALNVRLKLIRNNWETWKRIFD